MVIDATYRSNFGLSPIIVTSPNEWKYIMWDKKTKQIYKQTNDAFQKEVVIGDIKYEEKSRKTKYQENQ